MWNRFYKSGSQAEGATTNHGEKSLMKEDIGPVEQNFLVMMKVLSEADQDLIMAGIHERSNKLSLAHLVMLDKIDVYLVDPYRFGAKSLIGELHAVLLEATR